MALPEPMPALSGEALAGAVEDEEGGVAIGMKGRPTCLKSRVLLGSGSLDDSAVAQAIGTPREAAPKRSTKEARGKRTDLANRLGLIQQGSLDDDFPVSYARVKAHKPATRSLARRMLLTRPCPIDPTARARRRCRAT